MKVILTGYSGFLGSHLYKILSKKKYQIIKINLKTKKKLNKRFLINLLSRYKKTSILVNCAASLKPKTANDLFVNCYLPEILEDFSHKNKIKFIHLSTLNTLVKERLDPYSISKKIGEEKISVTKSSIVRLPLIYKKKNNLFLDQGELKIFFTYINLIRIPFYPFIYPGSIYKPIDVERACMSIHSLFKKKNNQIINLQGKKKFSTFKLFELICAQNNKACFKIHTAWVRKIVPTKFQSCFYKYNSFQQILSIDNTKIK